MNRNIILLVLLNISIFMSAQNQYRIGDRLQVQQISSQSFPNISGKDLAWKMQDNNMPRFYNDIKFINCADSSFAANISKLVEGTNYFYNLEHDFLLLKGYRNKKISVKYDLPITELTYPLAYGDSIQGYYTGKGVLANNKCAFIAGRYTTSVCGIGNLITLDSDTLDNTLLIKSTRLVSYKETCPNKIRKKYRKFENIQTSSYNQIEDQIKNDSNIIKVEKLSWYSPGYRYAILEVIEASCVNNNKSQKLFEYALYCAPEDQAQLSNDTTNEAIRNSLTNKAKYNQHSYRNAVFPKDYQIKQNYTGKNIAVSFSLEIACNIDIAIYAPNGSVLYQHHYGNFSKGPHTVDILLPNNHKITNQEFLVTIFLDGKPYTKKYIYN